VVSKKSGYYSFKSFKKAVKLAQAKKVEAILTLPINKQALGEGMELIMLVTQIS